MTIESRNFIGIWFSWDKKPQSLNCYHCRRISLTYAIDIVEIILEIFTILALDVPSLSCQNLNQSLSRWPCESRITISFRCTLRDKLLSKKRSFQLTAWSFRRAFFLAHWMYVYAENDLCEQISHLYLLFKIETFNNKKVTEVSFIKSVYLLISFDSHGFVIHFVIHFDALQRNFF